MSSLQDAFEAVLDVPVADASPLRSLYTACWDQLRMAAEIAEHPWRTVAMATVDGGRPQARSVVLRSVNASERVIAVYTDLRSPKVQQLQNNNAVTFLFYDHDSRIQLRLDGVASVATEGAVVDHAWQTVPDISRRNYQAAMPPGQPLNAESASDTETDDRAVPRDGILFARANFAVLVCTVEAIDWLYLRESGHLRAGFCQQDGHMAEQWLVP